MHTNAFDRWLDSIRAKPKKYKRRFAFGVSLGFTLVIFFVWATTFHIRQGSSGASLAAIATPFEEAGKTGGEAISVFSEKWGEAKDSWARFRGEVSAASTSIPETAPKEAGTR